MTVIRIDIRQKRYAGKDKAHTALSDLKFQVGENEFVSVLGPSGCGKTTMLNLSAGLDTDYAGEISMNPGALDHLAYVFQSPRLLPWRTAEQNVELALDDAVPSAAITSDLLAAVGMADFARHYPGELSLGMQRRVSLARAFACRPQLMLMDEPFVSLDPQAAGELRALLKSILAERPATVIFVTHDHREAVQLGDRVIVLSGSPAHVVKDVQVELSQRQRGDPAAIEKFVEGHLR